MPLLYAAQCHPSSPRYRPESSKTQGDRLRESSEMDCQRIEENQVPPESEPVARRHGGCQSGHTVTSQRAPAKTEANWYSAGRDHTSRPEHCWRQKFRTLSKQIERVQSGHCNDRQHFPADNLLALNAAIEAAPRCWRTGTRVCRVAR